MGDHIERQWVRKARGLAPIRAPNTDEAVRSGRRKIRPVPRDVEHVGHRLRQLDLSGCTSITDNAIKHFALAQQGAPALRDVSLSNCANLTDKSLRSLASLCATGKLERVAVAECANMTDHGVIGLAQVCRTITSIDISDDCWN